MVNKSTTKALSYQLSALSGTSFVTLTDGSLLPSCPGLARALACVAGFATVFVALGASASAVNQLLMQHMGVIAPIAGVVIVIFGLHYMGAIRIPFLNYEARMHPEAKPAGLVGAYVIGLA